MEKELFNKMINCDLINKVELYILLEDNESEEKVLDIIYSHLELDLMIYSDLVCPNFVKELVKLKYKEENIDAKDMKDCIIPDKNVMLGKHKFVDDLKYKEMIKNGEEKLITLNLYKRFCGCYLLKTDGILSLTVRQYKECLNKILKTKTVNEFKDLLRGLKKK